ncbi:MAG: primosomal protein N' [Candidatus Syntrophonatronum acetioxidans]|uniref:Replication restart protein PriA n=1 Tax=Candidatus Syntrophonatronum acetioxidans TaxID=1795816 RepID=A0A424YHS3_9FIRM|nr:MAG: primosomal protein N' [Candidatus Syntrophonatronum acetioxidans]
MEAKYARVVVDLPTPEVSSRFFHYLVPAEKKPILKKGMRVLVPFAGQKITGFVTGFDEVPQVKEVKEIIQVIDSFPLMTEELLELARWISLYYICPLGEVLRAILPSFYAKIKAKEIRYVKLGGSREETISYMEEMEGKAPRQREILNILLGEEKIALKELLNISKASHQTLNTLQKKGLVEFTRERVSREPFSEKLYGVSKPFPLSQQQEEALKVIKNSLYQEERKGPLQILLHGVTGSGKTEVYLQAIEEVIRRGREALVLVPEISLTPQMITWFRGRFGPLVTVLHSKLSHGERYDQWCKILEGEVKIVVGPRSAVFAPFSNLGIIIIDEEHETTYKQGESPRYDAREVAKRRGLVNKCPLLLGSATPSVESYYQAREGNNTLIRMESRVEKRPLPPVKIIDLKKEAAEGNRNIFSRELYWNMKKCLEKNQQVILFLNRRGFASFTLCKECGHVIRCPNCSITLTYHISDDLLKCHYCQFEGKVPQICPNCQGYFMRFLGLGTQKVEREAKRLFPGARVLRMDMDTTRGKNSHQEIFKAFKKGHADILIGTQMIAKGLDFPRVTLVGVILADTSLNFPDFRGGERTFQLLTQVAGRTGRSSLGGKVLVQTFASDHYSIESVLKHDYPGFYQEEISLRKDFQYPPFSSLLRVVFSGRDEDQLEKAALLFEKVMEVELPDFKGEILGPGPCPLNRIKDKFRWHLVIKTGDLDEICSRGKKVLEEVIKGFKGKDLRIIMDVNPVNML